MNWGDFHETREHCGNGLKWSTAFACSLHVDYVPSFLIVRSPPPTSYQQILLSQNSNTTFGLRSPKILLLGCVKPWVLNNFPALTLSTVSFCQQTASLSCQLSEKQWAQVNCSCVVTETPRPGQNYQGPMNGGKTLDSMSRLLRFILDLPPQCTMERPVREGTTHTSSKSNESGMRRVKTLQRIYWAEMLERTNQNNSPEISTQLKQEHIWFHKALYLN